MLLSQKEIFRKLGHTFNYIYEDIHTGFQLFACWVIFHDFHVICRQLSTLFSLNNIRVSSSLDPDQAQQNSPLASKELSRGFQRKNLVLGYDAKTPGCRWLPHSYFFQCFVTAFVNLFSSTELRAQCELL